jgi:endoglucanase
MVILSAWILTTTLPVSAKASIPVVEKVPAPCQRGHQVGYLSTFHSELVDASSGCRVSLTGINWFGFETGTFAPHGLWARNWQSMLKQIAQTGFNTIRLPYTNQLFDPASKPNGINYKLNPDLKGLQGLALMDRIIQGARNDGLKVILDRHDPTADQRPSLWYTDHMSQARWIQDWVMLAKHYKGNNTVIGADLANEPHSPATWGDGNPSTDWRLAAEKAGNAVLAANPQWLIIVEGVDQYQNDSYWWGGNLEGAAKYPVRLSKSDKLVYSAHDYGPSVYNQSWFQVPKPADLAHTLPAIWEKHWAYLQQDGIAPVFVGEFGGPSMGQDTEGVWQRTLVTFLKKHDISYTYWAWNANSGDTGGILNNDWTTINKSKVHVLSAYQWPLLDKSHSGSSKPRGSCTAS